MFAPGMGKRQRLTLILQAWGNCCTDPGEATHWTLRLGPGEPLPFVRQASAVNAGTQARSRSARGAGARRDVIFR